MTTDAMGKAVGRVGPGVVVLICFFIAALEGYDIQAFGVSAPKLAPELHLGPALMGNAGSAAMLGLVVGAFLGGWIADRIGRKPVLVVSVAAFGLFSVATALTHSYDTLLLARLATGLGFGGAMPNLIAVAMEISAPARRAATVTTMFCGMPAGGATVALVAKYAGAHMAWRDLFLIGGVLPLLLMPVVFWLLPETRPEPVEGSDRSLARALFGESRAAGTALLWVAFVLTLMILYLMLNWLPTLVIAKGLTPADGSTASLWFNLAGVVGALSVGFVVDRAGYRWPLAIVYAALAGAMYALASAAALNMVLILSATAGFMVLAGQYSLYAIAPTLYPPQVRAAGAGAAVGVGRIGSIAGPLVAGQLREAGYTAGQVFGFMTPVVLVAGLAVVALSYLSRPHAANLHKG